MNTNINSSVDTENGASDFFDGVTITVKYQISNWLPCVREALSTLGLSHYAVLRNVNSMLGRMNQKGETTAKNGSVKTTKKSGVNASVNVGVKFNSKDVYWQHSFAEWHNQLVKVDKLATIPAIELPTVFTSILSGIESLKGQDKE